MLSILYFTCRYASHASKVLVKVILARIQSQVEFEVAEEQAGFRPGRGTHNHLCSLRLITERARAHRQPLYMCFIDFEIAFDTVSHKKLWSTMVQMGFAPHIVSLTNPITV